MAFQTLRHMAGRERNIIAGLGNTAPSYCEEWLGLAWKPAYWRMREQVKIMRQVLNGAPIDVNERVLSIPPQHSTDWKILIRPAAETSSQSGIGFPRTPVIVGVGQVADRIDDGDYKAFSPIELAVLAARAAATDVGVDAAAVLSAIDTIATTRQFDNSVPRTPAPLGRSTKFPRSVADRLGANPRRAVLEVSGGQSPQHLVSEFSREIAVGRADVVLLAGAEADLHDSPSGQS